MQVHIRREPPKYQASREKRAKFAKKVMAGTVRAVQDPCRRLLDKAVEADHAVDPEKCITQQYAALTKVRAAPPRPFLYDSCHWHAGSCVLHASLAAQSDWRCSGAARNVVVD